MTKPMAVFVLTSENLTGLGGPMGTEHTWPNWRKIFHDLSSAKEYAEKDYRKHEGRLAKNLRWYADTKNCWYTDDLLFVMYRIQRTNVIGKL